MQLSKGFLICFCLLIGACENRETSTVGVDGKSSKIVSQEIRKASEINPAFIANQPFELGGLCNMEMLNGKLWGANPEEVRSANPISISGWGVDEKGKVSPKQIFLRLQDPSEKVYYVEAKMIPREDLSKHFNEEYFKTSGYSVDFSVSNLPLATYRAMIVMNANGKTLLCASGRSLIIKGA
jgi:hypothetical protein